MEFGIAISLVTAIAGTLTEKNGEIIRVQNTQELQKAIHEADSGDTILLEDGTYRLESSLWIENKENLAIKGESEDPEKVILMGGGWDGGKPRDVMVIRGSGNIAISYLTITEARSYGIKIEGVEGLRNPWDINISHCQFIDIGVRAVKGTATQDRKHMERRRCHLRK